MQLDLGFLDVEWITKIPWNKWADALHQNHEELLMPFENKDFNLRNCVQKYEKTRRERDEAQMGHGVGTIIGGRERQEVAELTLKNQNLQQEVTRLSLKYQKLQEELARLNFDGEGGLLHDLQREKQYVEDLESALKRLPKLVRKPLKMDVIKAREVKRKEGWSKWKAFKAKFSRK
jgi:uncharacterized protein (DUF3084 family)